MSIIDDLLNTYSTPATVPEAKKKAVELTSAEKLKALGGIKPDTFENVAVATQGDNEGAYSASPIETDLRNLRDYELRDKYGEEAQQLIDARTQGNIGIGVKKDFANSGTGALGTTQDVLVGAGHGLAGLVGGLAYLGTAGVDALAGTTASNDVATANKAVLDWINSGHTDENTIDTVVNTKQGALNRRDTKQLYDERVSDPNASKVDAFLRRIGQDFVDEVGNTASSPEQLTNLTGEAIGSIGGIGALTKAGTKVGTKILEGLTAKKIVEEGSKTTAALEKYGKEVFTTAIIGATEGGSVGAEAANKVLDMKIADLLKDPVQGKRIAALVADVGEEKAKEILAKEVGLSVAGKAAVIGAATGKLVSKFEGNPLAAVTPKQAYANLAAQSVEETLQEGSGQLLTNYEIGQKVKSNQDLAEDVGSNAAKGFLGGALGTATFNPVALSKPIVEPSAKAAIWLASETVKPIAEVSKWLGNKAANAFKNKLGEVNTGVLSNIAKASPISNERVAKAAQAITETVAPAQQVIQTIKENPEATEGNIKAAEYVSKLADALKFEVPPEGAMPPLFEKELSGVTTTVEAAQKLASIVDRKDVSEEDRFTAIENLHGLMTGVSDALLDGAEDALTEMENLPELQAYADNFTGLFNSFKDSPAMQGAIKHFDTILQVGVNLGHYKEIDVNNLADPDQQANLNKILNVASTTKASIPENIAQQINTISDMLTDSDMVTLTPQQKNQIRGLAEELKIAKALSEKAKAIGLGNVDIVNRQVSLDDAEERTFKYPSAREHSRGIVAAMAKGDLPLAKKRLETLQNFAVHFSNKIAALNEHIATAKPGVSSTVKYMAYRSAMGQEWSESKKGVYVNFNKQSSVELAKTIALEGLALGNIYNQLTKAYPELELKSFKVSEIDPKVTKGTSLDTLRDELLGKSPSTGTGTGEDLTKWTDVLNKHKGIANLNTNKDKLTQEDSEEVIAALKTLPTDFKTATKALGKSLNELRKYFGLPEGNITTDEDEDADEDNDNDPTPMDRWDKLLNHYGGIARLNANKEKFSNTLAESVYKILDALPKDFTMEGEYQKDFEEFKEYFLGKDEDSEPVDEATLTEVFDNIATGVSSTGNNTFVPNKEQAEGIAKIREFLQDPKAGNIFVLEGKAGTGKTSLIQEAVADILKSGGTVHVAAVSHKAKGVLEKKLKAFIKGKDLRGKVEASSLASLLGMKRDEETGDFVEDPNASGAVNKVRVLIVDEASMVNVQNKQILESKLPKGAKLIYVGDRNQIAPIEKRDSPNLGKISQVFTMNTGKNKHSLVTRVRQGEDSTILPYADYYWNNAEGENSVADPVPTTARKNTKEMVMLKVDGWVEKVIPLFKRAFETGNANLVKVMAFNNISGNVKGAKILREAEFKIREALFGEDRQEYNKGELLMMTSNFAMGEKGTLENSAELVVISSTPTTQSVPLPNDSEEELKAFNLDVKDTNSGKEYSISVIAEESKARHKQIYESWGVAAKKNRNLWTMFWTVKEKIFAPVNYSYIITTHKAQGSTYDVAVVLEDNINGSPDTIANKSRIMYTAITRPSKLAIVVSNRNPALPITLVGGSANTPTANKTPNVQVGDDPNGWLNQQAQLARSQADKANLTEEIEGLFAKGLTASQVRKEIDSKLVFIPEDEKNSWVVSVRATLGIPSRMGKEGEEDFAKWLEEYNKRKGKSPTKKFSWGRESKDGYEVSSSGDSRFSALTAKLKDGRTIEEAYQLDVKGYRVKGNNWKLGKGKAPLIELTLEESWKAYKALWEQWAFENKALMQELANKANGKTLTDKFANTEINQARALSEVLNENPTFDFKEPKNVTKKIEVASESSSVLKPEDVTNHSGGALGSDSLWDELGQLFGKITNKHYWATERTPKGNTIVTNPDYIEGTKEAAKAANRNFGYQYATMKNALLIRNWSQVKYADAIFAIGSIVGKGEPVFPNIKGDTRTAINPSVTGGTGYAVGMGIIHKKPVYVFNQTATKNYEQGWYVWDNTAQDFKKTDVPALTKNFAGIGTRNINEAGKQAIMDVFTKAFGKPKGKLPTTETPKENQLEITKDSILSVDYQTTIEISEGTYDSAMQALTVVMYRYVKKTEHNYAVLQEALATSDPDELRRIQDKYKDLHKNFNGKITEAMSRIIHSYVHSHPEVAEYLQENSQAELVFKDQNNFWKGRLSKIYEAVLSELKAISKLPENGKITAKPTLKNLFSNLLSASKFLEAFVLGSKNEDTLLNQTSPLSYLVSKLDTEVAEDSSFKKQAKQAWRGLLATEVPNVVEGLNTAVQDFLSNRIKMTSRTTNGTIAKIAISALRDEDIDPVVAQALKDAGISSGDLEGISQLIIDEGIIKSIPKKIEKLENDKATYKKQMPKNYTVFWEGIDEKIVKLKEELEKTADNLKGNLLYSKLNTLKGILVDKQGEIPLSTLVSYRELSRTPAGKILGLVEHTGEEYVVNARIAETIAVAALSWLANTRLADKPVDSEQAAKILGIKETAVTAEHLRILNKAQHSTVVIQEIADTVKSFLDVKENTNNPLGNSEGLLLSIASNVLDVLVERGFVSVSNIQIRTSDATGNAKDVVKEYNFFTAEGFNGTIYKQVPEVVEEVVSEEFAKRKQYFVGSPQKMKVPNNVNHHPIPLTQDQKDMVDAAQQISNYINTPILDFFNAIGSEGLVYLFANGELDEDLMHPLDFVAKKGKNDSIANAWEKVQTVVKDITDKANFWRTKAENVAVYFGKGVTSVSRLQYSDAYNMQSSKIARPVIVATKKKVDLTKPEEEINFLIGIAQGMGVKVHNLYDYNAIAKLNNILGSEEVKAVFELLDSKKSQYSSEDLEVLKKVMPLVDNTEWGLTNLVEYHRFLRANANQRKSFEHAVATEADGVTNGSANSLHILSGEINEELIELWRMTGYFIGNEPRTLNEEREDNPTDIYLKTALVGTDLVAKNITKMKNSMSSENGVIVDDVVSLMKLFNVTVKVNPSGDLELTRPSTKNSTTVTLYGSGVKGISEKILGELLAEIHAEISLKLQGKGKLMDEYVHNETARILSNLSTYSIIRPNPDSNPSHPLALIARETNLLKFPAFNASPAELKAFVVNTASFDTIVSNISKVYTDPLSKAIEKVVGKQTSSNTNEMIYASTLQAQIMRSYYHARIRESIENKLRTDPLYIQSDYLSKQELEAIRKETMDKFGGLYSDQYQNSTVYLTTLKSSLDGLPYTGASLKDTNRAFPVLSDFDNPSVSIAPNMVIRTDGLAIQHLINDPENDMNMLYIFDGIMMNTSDIKKGSLLANKAVFRTWTEQTPMRLVADSFRKAADAADFDNLLPELVVELIGYFKEKIPAEDKETDVSPKEQVMQALGHLASSLDTRARLIESQQALVKALPGYTDQMAAVGMPYYNEGTITQEELDAGIEKDGLVNFLKQKQMEILLTKEPNKKKANPVKVIKSKDYIEKTRDSLATLVPAASAVITAVIDAFKQSDYTIIIGSMKDASVELEKMGLTEAVNHAKSKSGGAFVSYKDKVIVSSEDKDILHLHELIHASTSTSLAFGLSDTVATTASEKRAKYAAKQLRILLAEFLSEEFVSNFEPNSEGESIYLKIKDELLTHYANNEFRQISEMLAYLLPDQRTYDGLLKANTKASIPAKFLEAIKKAISYFFGSIPEEHKDGFYANLVFHASSLAHDNMAFENDVGFSDYTEESTRLSLLTARLRGLIKSDLDSSKPLEKSQKTLAMVKQVKEMKVIHEAGFRLNQEETDAYSAMLLATKLGLNTNSSASTQLQEVFSRVVANVTPESFYPNKNPSSLQKEIALDKYDALFGRYNHGKRVHEDILANFAALASVSSEVRDIVSKVLAKQQQVDSNPSDVFDTFMGNLGDRITSGITQYAGNAVKVPKSSVDYLDALVDVLFSSDENRTIKENTMMQDLGAKADSLNDWLADAIQKGSSKLNTSTEGLRSSNNKALKTVGNITKLVNAFVNKDLAEVAALDINKSMNRKEGFQELRDLMRDLIGRTEDNALIYDLVKPIRVSVDKLRQNYKTQVPIAIQGKFKNKLGTTELKSLGISLAKTGIGVIGSSNVIRLATGKMNAQDEIAKLEQYLEDIDGNYAQGVKDKAKQLANYNINGIAGNMLLRNPEAIARQFGMPSGNKPQITKAYINKVSELVALYSYEELNQQDKDILSRIAELDSEALVFTTRFLDLIRAEDKQSAEINLDAKANIYFGYLPQNSTKEGSLIVAADTEYADLVAKGYTRVGDYVGDSRDPLSKTSRGYFYNPVDLGQEYRQGVLQNIRSSTMGVDLESGLSTSRFSAGVIADPKLVEKILKSTYQDNTSGESLLPIFNSAGRVIAFERTMSNKQIEAMVLDTDISKLLGSMRGRQIEESTSRQFLTTVAEALKSTYDSDPDKTQYVDLFDMKEVSKDKVLAFGVDMLSHAAKEEIIRVFGNSFYVKREMLTDVVGFRKASVTDVFTGVSRLSPETVTALRQIALSVFGKSAYKYMAYSEKYLQDGVLLVKTNIVVKSVVVLVANILSNALHLLSLGIPFRYTVNQVPKKVAEIEYYMKASSRLIQLEVEIAAAVNRDNQLANRLYAEKKSIDSALSKLSIAPLIEAGELSNINDVGLGAEDSLLFSGRLGEYLSALTDKTPSGLRAVGRHLLLAKDTALYEGLQKGVLYGDFIAKSVQYDYLTKVKKVPSKEAVVTVSAEFISYDHLPGRGRDYLESIGLLWFYNYKLRAVKIAANTIRNNPLYALMYAGVGGSQLGIDSPIDSNVVSQVFDGSIGYSLGIGMGIDGIFANPYGQLIH